MVEGRRPGQYKDRTAATAPAREPVEVRRLPVGDLRTFDRGASWTQVSSARKGLLTFSEGTDVLGFARALGRGWTSLDALKQGHAAENRDVLLGVERMWERAEAGNEEWLLLGAATPRFIRPGHDMGFDTGILIGQGQYWEPIRRHLTSDGQTIRMIEKPVEGASRDRVRQLVDHHAKTVGREKAVLAMNSRDYDLVVGHFTPNWASSQVNGGGTADLTYFWDRTTGELSLCNVQTRDLQNFMGPIVQGDVEYPVIQGNKFRFDIRPFGIFAAPAVMSEAALAYNINFPSRIPLYDPNKGGEPDDLVPKKDYSYNIFDITQVESWRGLGADWWNRGHENE